MCLIGGIILYCVLAFIYFEISSSPLLLVALVDSLICFRCTIPVDLVVGAFLNSQLLVLEQGQLEDVCDQVRYSEVRGVINFSRWQIRMKTSLGRAG